MSDPALPGKVAAITGAGSGLGRTIAKKFAAAGANIAILELDEETGEDAASELDALGSAVQFIPTDVSDSDQVSAAITQVAEAFGQLDIMVNNAGIDLTGPHTHEVTDADWHKALGVMQTGVFYGMREAGKIMVQQGTGSVLNMSSIRGFSPIPGRMTYSPAKAAVIMMTKIAAGEWGQHGIRVNAIAPGFTKTPMHDHDVARGMIDEDAYLSVIPAQRFGVPEDIAALATFLCSDDAAYITGACITIDGGLTTIASG